MLPVLTDVLAFSVSKKKIYRLKNLIRLINAWSVSFVDDKTELIQRSPLVPPPSFNPSMIKLIHLRRGCWVMSASEWVGLQGIINITRI